MQDGVTRLEFLRRKSVHATEVFFKGELNIGKESRDPVQET